MYILELGLHFSQAFCNANIHTKGITKIVCFKQYLKSTAKFQFCCEMSWSNIIKAFKNHNQILEVYSLLNMKPVQLSIMMRQTGVRREVHNTAHNSILEQLQLCQVPHGHTHEDDQHITLHESSLDVISECTRVSTASLLRNLRIDLIFLLRIRFTDTITSYT